MAAFPLKDALRHPIVSARVPTSLKQLLLAIPGSPSESETVARILDAVFRAHGVIHIEALIAAIEAGHCAPRMTPFRAGRGKFRVRLDASKAGSGEAAALAASALAVGASADARAV